jgi:hypothetical protein
MSNGTDPNIPDNPSQEDWWSTRFGNRGLLQLVVGDDVEFILGVMGLGTLVYLILGRDNYDVLGSFVNILFFVIIFSFFAKLIRILIATIQTGNRAGGRT